jgi:hypothetical protein
MDRMAKPLLSVLILLGSSATAAAQPAAPAAPPVPPAAAAPAPAGPPAAVPEPAPAAPPAAAVEVRPAATAPAAPGTLPAPTGAETQVIGAGTTSPVVVEPPAQTEPASITEVGVQRLPASAYPEWELRGLKHSSLWLTFHGMQWPYMPSATGDKRFVIGVSGWGWIDTSYQKFAPWGENPNIELDRIKYWKQQARMLLRLTPTYAINRDSFIQGQVELVGTGDQTISRSDVGGADTDDLWIRAGQWRKWDVQVGRFEGWEVFHLGMGLDFNTFERRGAVGPGESANNIQFYGLTDNQFRPPGAAGNAAVHVYPLRFLRFELLGMAGSFGTNPGWGTRPVGILDFGWVKLKLGTEYQRLTATQASDQTEITSKGVGGALQFVFAPHVEFGINAAQGTVWNIDRIGVLNAQGSITRSSLGAFANVSNGHPRHTLLFGVGSLITWTEDQNGITPNPIDRYWLYQGFLAAQYVVHNALYIKLVGGYSRGHWSLAGNDPRVEFDNEMYSLRLRFSFYF